MQHARCLWRLNKDELERFSSRCHCWSGLSSEESGPDSADVKGYFRVGGWNEILCVKIFKNISTRKELNTSHGTKEHVEW